MTFQCLGWETTLLGISCKDLIPKVSHDGGHITFWRCICSLGPTDAVWVYPSHAFQSPIILLILLNRFAPDQHALRWFPILFRKHFWLVHLAGDLVSTSSIRKHAPNETSNSLAILCAHQFGSKHWKHLLTLFKAETRGCWVLSGCTSKASCFTAMGGPDHWAAVNCCEFMLPGCLAKKHSDFSIY